VAPAVVPLPLVVPSPDLGVVGFGCRRLGLVVVAGFVPLGAALGRLVRNAPRTSSSAAEFCAGSCASVCAEAGKAPKPANAISKLKKTIFLFIAISLLKTKHDLPTT
jgi:hypothetical protein